MLLSEDQAQPRLKMLRQHVAKPIPTASSSLAGSPGPWTDPNPALVEGTGMLIGNKYHASRVDDLVAKGVTAVLNCASGGISRLPMDDLQAKGIQYSFTNVRQDEISYPILFDPQTGKPSKHLQVAKSLYSRVRQEQNGRVLFFCVAGQNRYVSTFRTHPTWRLGTLEKDIWEILTSSHYGSAFQLLL